MSLGGKVNTRSDLIAFQLRFFDLARRSHCFNRLTIYLLVVLVALTVILIFAGDAEAAVKRISNSASGGDCASIGVWDAAVKRCTLTTDIVATGSNGIDITSDGITLDGNGHTLTGSPGNYYGVTITMRTGISVKNLIITGFKTGMYLTFASNNTIFNNNFLNNATQASVSGMGNSFGDPGTGRGNYWSNFDTPEEGCNDSDGNGICDAAYAVGTAQDGQPWNSPSGWQTPPPPDTEPPSITSVKPDGNISSGSAMITIAYADTGGSNVDTFDGVAITLDGAARRGCNITQTGASCSVAGLASGPHSIGGTVADNSGNSATITGSFSVDPLRLGFTMLVSSDDAGTAGNASSYVPPAISEDGSYTAFASQASNLVGGDTNSAWDVFMKDNRSGATYRVSTSANGTQANNSSNMPAVSGNGRYVALRSAASNLVIGDNNNMWDIFRKDIDSGAIVRVSTGATGAQANGASDWPAISDDGRYVAFVSSASNLVSGDTNGAVDVFIKDMQTGAVTRVSTDSAGAQANAASDRPALSADGRYAVYRSLASNLAGSDSLGKWDIFRKDTVSGATISLSSGGNGDSGWPSVSDDGNLVAFPSQASNLVAGDTNGWRDIFLADAASGLVTRVTTDASGRQVSGFSGAPAISGDGRYVAFFSGASTLVAGDTNNVWDIFRKELATGAVVRFSTGTDGVQAGWASDYAAISGDGRHVAYVSQANNLAPADGNGAWDVFLSSKTPPAVTNMRPAGSGYATSVTIAADFVDEGGDIDTGGVTVSLDGSALGGCSVTGSGVSCPVSGMAAGVHTFSISVTDRGGVPAQGSGSFTVLSDTAPPVITGLQPEGAGRSPDVDIAAGYSDDTSGIDTGSVQVILDGSPMGGCSVTAAGASCRAAALNDGVHGYEVTVADIAGNISRAAGSFIVDTVAPSLTGVLPSGTFSGASTTIHADLDDGMSGIDPASARVLLNNQLVSGCTVSPASVDCPVNVGEGTYEYQISAADAAGNVGTVTNSFLVVNLSVQMRITGTVHDASVFSGADGLDVVAGYAYVVSGFSNDLTIVDITDPASPQIAFNLTDSQGRLNRPWGVEVVGNYAYVAAGYMGDSDRLTIVDISDPTAPFVAGSVQDYVNLDGALHVFISGNYAYVTAPAANRMSVVDISDPANPMVVGSVRDDVRLYAADGVSVSGNVAYVVSHQLDGGSEKSYLNAVDISDPTHPVIIGALNSPYFRGGDQMSIAGNHIFVPGNLDHTLSIVDISNPAAMKIVSHITDDVYIGQSCFLDISGQYVYLTSANNNRLTLVDISNVNAPRIVGSIQDDGSLYSALYVIVSGGHAYVTSPAGTLAIVEVLQN